MNVLRIARFVKENVNECKGKNFVVQNVTKSSWGPSAINIYAGFVISLSFPKE